MGSGVVVEGIQSQSKAGETNFGNWRQPDAQPSPTQADSASDLYSMGGRTRTTSSLFILELAKRHMPSTFAELKQPSWLA